MTPENLSAIEYTVPDWLSEILKTLSDREQVAVSHYYGLNGEPGKSLRKTGLILNVGAERVRQIKVKALRKMRHPTRLNALYASLGEHCDEQLEQTTQKFIFDVFQIPENKPEKREQLIRDAHRDFLKAENDKRYTEIRDSIYDRLLSDDEFLDSLASRLEIPAQTKIKVLHANQDIPIEHLNLSARSYNALNRVDIKMLSNLIDKTLSELEKVRNLGKKSVKEILSKLKELGYALRPEDSD